MSLKDVRVGFAITGSFCTIKEILPHVEKLVNEGAQVIPILSPAVDETDTRFGTATEWKRELKSITGSDPINSIVAAEPIGPKGIIDILVVAPCTGNTLAKLANGITDTSVLMAIKAHLRNERPVVLAFSTNDGLSMNAKNIGMLLNMKNIYVVPFGQDNPIAKPNSLVAKMEFIMETVVDALAGKQIQPLLVIK